MDRKYQCELCDVNHNVSSVTADILLVSKSLLISIGFTRLFLSDLMRCDCASQLENLINYKTDILC